MDTKISELKLPLGFRFLPTDEELIVHYLRRKVLSIPIPAPAVTDFDVFQTHPRLLPGEWKEKRYFFSERKGNTVNKSSGTIISCNDFGYWKSIGKEEIVVIFGTDQAIGKKKSLVFYERQKKTQWFMDLYCLLVCPSPNTLQRCMIEIDDWVVSRIYQKKSKAKNKGVKNRNKEENMGSSEIMDFITVEENRNELELGPPQPCSSTELSTTNAATAHEFQEEEICSSFV